MHRLAVGHPLGHAAARGTEERAEYAFTDGRGPCTDDAPRPVHNLARLAIDRGVGHPLVNLGPFGGGHIVLGARIDAHLVEAVGPGGDRLDSEGLPMETQINLAREHAGHVGLHVHHVDDLHRPVGLGQQTQVSAVLPHWGPVGLGPLRDRHSPARLGHDLDPDVSHRPTAQNDDSPGQPVASAERFAPAVADGVLARHAHAHAHVGPGNRQQYADVAHGPQ